MVLIINKQSSETGRKKKKKKAHTDVAYHWAGNLHTSSRIQIRQTRECEETKSTTGTGLSEATKRGSQHGRGTYGRIVNTFFFFFFFFFFFPLFFFSNFLFTS